MDQDKLAELDGQVQGLEYKFDFIREEITNLRKDNTKIINSLASIEERLPKGPTSKRQAFQVSAAGMVGAVLVVLSDISWIRDFLDKVTR